MNEQSQSKLPTYRILGRSGLRVFPLCLGAMGFNTSEQEGFFKKLGVGTGSESEVERIFLRYIEAGGNFIDTANMYQSGESEELIGKLMHKHNIDRESLIIATKYAGTTGKHANASGNHKKHMIAALDASLKRLQTSYVDIFYVHVWDFTMEMEDLMRDLQHVINTGKVLHIAISDTPAWLVAIGNKYADQHGLAPFISFQVKYSLVSRDIEQEILPMALKLNIPIVPWGVVGQGKLTGSRKRNDKEEGSPKDSKRVIEMTESDFNIQDKVLEIAKDLNRSPSQVALNWVVFRRGITSAIIGPRTLDQLNDLLKTLEFRLTDEQIQQLDEVSKNNPSPIFPHSMIGTSIQNNILSQWSSFKLE